MPADFQPSATLDVLRLRAKLLAFTRQYFDESGCFEVDTPILSHERVIDPNIEPFVVSWSASERLFLQTSPEFAMKRLLAAGAEAIYQLGKVFRHGELGRLHNPEFTMLEWYRVGDTHHEQMTFVEKFVTAFACEVGRQSPQPSAFSPQPFERLTYDQAFERHAGSKVLTRPTDEIVSLARRLGVSAPESLLPDDRDGWLNLLLAERVEPHLGHDRPTFVFDYPASQAALARVRGEGQTAVAERFELYVHGIELCNGYHELTDAAALRTRIRRDASACEKHIPEPIRLLAAMDSGLPASSGVALGFDRLLMLSLGHDSVRQVIPFPFEIA
ncbi:elongation factor P--(R)-beta-lysine ligase [Planctomycetia bacterium]|nr:elongation factor P--(R)-beta-lysine ligase [Planctomycetia bacterium]